MVKLEKEGELTRVQKLAKEIERQENIEVIVTDKFSIEAEVAFWHAYLNSGSVRGWRPKRHRNRR